MCVCYLQGQTQGHVHNALETLAQVHCEIFYTLHDDNFCQAPYFIPAWVALTLLQVRAESEEVMTSFFVSCFDYGLSEHLLFL